MNQKKNTRFKNPQNIIAIGVTIISLCALLVSLMQTGIMKEERELMREYSRASVWPRVEWSSHKSHNPDDRSIEKFVIYLSNSGVGPAIITDVKVTYNGKIANNWWDIFQYQEIPDSIETTISNRSFNGRILKIGETLEILNLNHNPPLAEAFYNRIEGLEVEIYYESIYKEKWKYDIENTTKLEQFEGLKIEEQFD